tara:strand:- start:198 stop:590 length:393 start_codon:yes stop_codon:yes gene_type:complete
VIDKAIISLISLEWGRELTNVNPPFFLLKSNDDKREEDYKFALLHCTMQGKYMIFEPFSDQVDYVVFFIDGRKDKDNCVTSYWFPIREQLKQGKLDSFYAVKHLIHKIKINVGKPDLLYASNNILSKEKD